MGFENTCTVPGKLNVLRIISRLYGWVCKTLRRNPLVVDHRVVVMTAGSHQDVPKFNPFRFPVYEFQFRISGGIKF